MSCACMRMAARLRGVVGAVSAWLPSCLLSLLCVLPSLVCLSPLLLCVLLPLAFAPLRLEVCAVALSFAGASL